MHVRTDDGRIGKFEKYVFNNLILNLETCDGHEFVPEDHFVNGSCNPIDLLEDEDMVVIEYYVAKYRQRISRVFDCTLYKSKDEEIVIFENKHCDWWYNKTKKRWINAKGYNPKLKYIVTKEQFESCKYEVK